MKLKRNDECRLTNGGIALRGIGITIPTSRRLRSVITKQTEYIIRCSMLDVRLASYVLMTMRDESHNLIKYKC
jgi:hypothetical protein